MTKAESKKLFSILIASAPLNITFVAGPELSAAILLTKHLPIVYAELPKPQFQVQNVQGTNGRSNYRCLHIWKALKWIPITATRVFAAKNPNASSSKRKRVLSALRTVVKPQIDGFKALIVFPIECPLSKKQLLNFSATHVDHYKLPFIHIVENFLQLKRRTIESISLGRDGLIGDQKLAVEFYRYHMEVCDLQLVDKTANMKKGKKLL